MGSTLPAPVFWGVLAAWIPIPPAVMAGVLCAVMIFALGQSLFSLREWTRDDLEDEEQFLAEPQLV